MKRFVFATDLHGDMQEPAVVAKLFDFTALWKPHVRIFGGDLFDFRALRRGASIEERSESMRSDLDAGQSFLKRWQPHYYLRGNHCERLFELAEFGQGVEADYAQRGVSELQTLCGKLKCQMLPYHKRRGVLDIGPKFLHGFYCGVTATRQHALTYGACLHGHTHTIDEASVPGLDRRTARGVGGLCRLDMRYNERMPQSLRQANGWAYGVINERTGNYWPFQAESFDGKWIFPTGHVEL